MYLLRELRGLSTRIIRIKSFLHITDSDSSLEAFSPSLDHNSFLSSILSASSALSHRRIQTLPHFFVFPACAQPPPSTKALGERDTAAERLERDRAAIPSFLLPVSGLTDGRGLFVVLFARKSTAQGRSPWPTIVYAMRVTAIALLGSARTEDCGVFWSCLPKCLKDGIAGPFLASQPFPVRPCPEFSEYFCLHNKSPLRHSLHRSL